uniref:Uncharacterized protein n=1 Tax=Oryza glumipatula TaxID=40148 RepID=A0A0E0AGZ0_9ORYZ
MAPPSSAQATASTLSQSSPWPGRGEELHEECFAQQAGKMRCSHRQSLPCASHQARGRDSLMRPRRTPSSSGRQLLLTAADPVARSSRRHHLRTGPVPRPLLPPPHGTRAAAAAAASVRPSLHRLRAALARDTASVRPSRRRLRR